MKFLGIGIKGMVFFEETNYSIFMITNEKDNLNLMVEKEEESAQTPQH